MKFFCKLFLFFTLCCSFARLQEQLIYPVERADQLLVTKINCRVGELRHFKYNSLTTFWEDIDGKIAVTADLTLVCLGNDTGGTFGDEGLKYQGKIISLAISENENSEVSILKRRKRGIGDFFSNAWTRVKNFFKGLFGGAPEPERPPPRPEITDRSQPPKPPSEVEDDRDDPADYEYEGLYGEPFKFVQMANGSVPKIWFTEQDADSRVRNFKRHLVDAFASQLSLKPQHSAVVENTVMGEHVSNYNISTRTYAASLASSVPWESEDMEFGDVSTTVTVDKVVTQDDILKFAPDSSEASAVNDVGKMDLQARQTQIFKSGKLISTSGTSSLSIFDGNIKSRRSKRSIDDMSAYHKVHTNYELQLTRIQKRSADLNHLTDEPFAVKDADFSVAGRLAELEEISMRQRLRELQKSIGDASLFVQNLMKDIQNGDEESNNEKLQIMLEVVEQEVRSGLDQELQSISKEIRNLLTKQVLDEICFTKFKSCVDLLQLLTRAGGGEAERILLDYLNDDSSKIEYREAIADLLSDLSNPSLKVIDDLITMLTSNRLDPRLLGPVVLGASNLAIAAEDDQKKKMTDVVLLILDAAWSPIELEVDPLTLDSLEAIGNIGDVAGLDKLLKVCNEASQIEVQISCAHAMRFMSHSLKVQAWIQSKLSSGTCDVIHAIIGSLLDNIHQQESSGDDQNWPRTQFNGIDMTLKRYLENSPPQFECAVTDTIRYFKRKKNPEAQELASNFFDEDTEPFEPGSNSRQRRSVLDVWDDLNCNEWMDDNKYTPIQNKDEFSADRKMYNKRKSCLAYRKLGRKGAGATIYAGMFAGVKQPSDPPKYKLFSKFVSSVNFLGHESEIGSFYFYHNSGNTKSYVRILGKTRQEFRHEGCTPSDLRYRPITHIPLYQVQVAVVQLSLGIHLSSELILETKCPGYDRFGLKPMTKVRVGGEAKGTILFARAAMNIGGNFNYHLDFTFSPVPSMCLRGTHGHEPMSISVEAYYQLWRVVKLNWAKPKIWQPDFLAWDITGSNRRPWFNDTCILDDKVASATTVVDAATAPLTDVIPPSLLDDDENDVARK